MSHCCSSPGSDSTHPGKRRCPDNGRPYSRVPLRTVLHHFERPWDWRPSATQYYFCDDADCEVGYFGADGSVIPKSRLRTCIGAKPHDDSDLLCYCFGVSRADYASDPATREFVVAQTRSGACACEIRNPSGRCCLKDFPDLSKAG